MLDIVTSNDNLFMVIEKIRNNLANATSYAEILEVKELAELTYDKIKSELRIAKKKSARDDIIKLGRRTQGDVALMISRAEYQLSKEYDAAKERGEVAGYGNKHLSSVIPEHSGITPKQSEIKIDSRRLSEARKFGEFDEAHPGKVEEFIEEIIEKGDEPTKAAINQKIKEFKNPVNDIEVENRETVICPKCGHHFAYRRG